ncbi:MAG: O-antigen ligase family protein [Sphingobium sp.]
MNLFRRGGRPSENGLYEILFVGALAVFLISVCFKLFSLGVATFLIFSLGLILFRENIYLVNATLILTILYIADSTVTSFMVSNSEGVKRTIQFVIIASGLIGIFLYSFRMAPQAVTRLLLVIGTVSVAIFAISIFYHLSNGRYLIWKDLYDTKFVYSLLAFILFSLKDYFERKNVPFIAMMLVLFLLIGASGERKALLLFVVIAAVSTLTLRKKIIAAASLAAIACAIYVTGIDGGFIDKKMDATFAKHDELPSRYFFTVSNIGQQSDVIRSFVNENANRLFSENPIFGMGATGYQDWSRHRFGAGTDLAMGVHGEIHRVPVEGGLVGIFIALGYLAFAAFRTIGFAFFAGDGPRTSLQSAPFYLLLYVISFASFEATNTVMLVLIGLLGVVAARLPTPGMRDYLRSSRAKNMVRSRLRRPNKTQSYVDA